MRDRLIARSFTVTVFDHYNDTFAIGLGAEGVTWPFMEELQRAEVGLVWLRLKPPFGPELRSRHSDVARHQFWRAEWRDCLHALFRMISEEAPHIYISGYAGSQSGAHLKACQLKVALRLGFNIPETVIGNEPRALAERFPNTVLYKPVSAQRYDDRGPPPVALFETSQITENEAAVRAVPGIYQNEIPKAHELRVHVFGARDVSVRINSQAHRATQLDWRLLAADPTLYEPTEISEDLRLRLAAFLDHFGLDSGVFDLAVTPRGEHIFFECNPDGQWAGLEEELGLPLSEHAADELVRRAEKTQGAAREKGVAA
ncbi:hypothetical protein Q0812_11780 [Brevundimonas sp. 2R-24]|uniref:ATP-grasp domain-containing protein n=1 Tax=Peiella sedimenti TaxID=3061083 RepID=A0ABT8SNN9_9CAUL|nr:hypothetical protein [Caulobacteraceae bacterium XZ-24]